MSKSGGEPAADGDKKYVVSGNTDTGYHLACSLSRPNLINDDFLGTV